MQGMYIVLFWHSPSPVSISTVRTEGTPGGRRELAACMNAFIYIVHERDDSLNALTACMNAWTELARA